MELLKVFTDDRAVSPVIGVILMVAVTVILAAVIGTFVLGIGSQVTSETPKVSVDFAFDDGTNAGFNNNDDSVTITHRGGDDVPIDTLTVKASGSSLGMTWNDGGDGELNAGDTGTFTESGSNPLAPNKKVQLIWKSSDTEGTAILGEDTVSD